MAGPLRPYPRPPPPSGLMAIELFFLFFFSHKIAGNGFEQFFSAPNFWIQIAQYFQKNRTILVKKLGAEKKLSKSVSGHLKKKSSMFIKPEGGG